MSRPDRVLDLLDVLRANDAMPVAQIAAALRVSRRTVLRDLALLRDRGWPIRAEPGPGGGVVLDRDRGAAAVHLTVDEIASLWLASQLAARISNVPWSAAARSALAKVIASVPKDRGRVLRQLLRRVVVGRPATARVLEALEAPPPELLVAFESAFARDACLAFDYTDRHGNRTRRIVEPHGLLLEAPAWYLLTRDAESGDARMFRMDRIRRPRVFAERRFTPDFEGLRRQAHEQRRRESNRPAAAAMRS
jgi:predicted DNA-binding transcriptional regulator YafY